MTIAMTCITRRCSALHYARNCAVHKCNITQYVRINFLPTLQQISHISLTSLLIPPVDSKIRCLAATPCDSNAEAILYVLCYLYGKTKISRTLCELCLKALDSASLSLQISLKSLVLLIPELLLSNLAPLHLSAFLALGKFQESSSRESFCRLKASHHHEFISKHHSC